MKRQHILLQPILILLVTFLYHIQPVQAGQYFQDFTAFSTGTTTNFGDGSALFSNDLGPVAQVGTGIYKELILTHESKTDTRSAFLLPDLDPGTPVYAFSAKWNSTVYGTFPNAADGFSFSFGQVGSLNLTNTIYSQEAGYGTGIAFGAQTFAGNAPGFYLRINGNVIASQSYDPTTQWGVNNPTRHLFEVDWSYTNGITVRMDQQTIFSNVATPGLTVQSGNRFVWAARTGGATEQVGLDNIVVVTGGNLKQVPLTSPYYKDGEGPQHEADKAFDNDDNSSWLTFNAAGYIGATASSARNIRAYSVNAPYTGGNGADPRIWTLEGSNNGGTNWSVCASGSGYFLNHPEVRGFLATNSAAYNAFRLNISANNGAGTTAVGELRVYEFIPVAGGRWSPTSLPGNQGWTSLACSANGNILYAVGYYTPLYVSTDAGQTWVPNFSLQKPWRSVSCVTNGDLAWVATDDRLYYTIDTGGSWHDGPDSPPGELWTGVTMSGVDFNTYAGTKNNGSTNGGIYRATAAGYSRFSGYPGGLACKEFVCSKDKQKFTASVVSTGAGISAIQWSTNAGNNWTVASGTAPFLWQGLSSSYDGNTVLCGDRTRTGVYRSVDAGNSWTKVLQQSTIATASSADGTKLVAVGDSSEPFGIKTSVNGGATWDAASGVPASVTWRCVASSANGQTMIAGEDWGSVWMYRLDAPATPSAVTGSSSSIGQQSATISGQGNPHYVPATVSFQWGLTTNYGNVTAAQNIGNGTNNVSVTASLSGLTAGATYHYRAVCTSSFGTAYGNDATFTAYPPTPPSVTTGQAAADSLFKATLNGSCTPNLSTSTAWFQWGLTTNYGNTTSQQNIGNGTNSVSYSAAITGLTAGATYHYRAVASNVTAVAYGTNVSFSAAATDTVFDIVQENDLIVPTSTNSPASQSATNAIDNSITTKYLNLDKLNAGFTVFPLITNFPVQALGLISAEDAPERDPASFALFGSVDGSNFTLIASNAVPTFADRRVVQSFGFANTNTYSSYKIIFPAVQDSNAANSVQIAEVELFRCPEISSANDSLTLSLPPDANLNGVGPTNSILDRSVGGSSNKLVVLNVTNNVVATITPAAGACILKGLEFIGSDDDASYSERTPSSLTIEGSNNGTNFVSLLSVTPETPTANLQIQGFSCFGNTNAYTLYRVTFGPPKAGNILQVGELRLFGQTSPKVGVATAGNNLVVSWPASGFVLQQSTNLGSTNWINATNGLSITNGQTQTTISPAGGNKFYRVKAQ